MKYIRLSLIGIAISVSPLGHADVTACPWLNHATAAGVLEEPTIMSVDVASMDNSVCKFHSVQGGESIDLQIAVKMLGNSDMGFESYKKQCASTPTAIQSVGNEAYLCTIASEKDTAASIQSESVIGRVRSHVFTVTLSMETKSNPPLTKEDVENKIHSVAEQVAGSLY
jgi:hypothetical protein